MKAIGFVAVWGFLVAGGWAAGADEKKSIAVDDVVLTFERTVAEIEAESAAELGKLRAETVRELQTAQDRLCRDAKLDEAVAVRDVIRGLRGDARAAAQPAETPTELPRDLPPEAAETVLAYQARAQAARKKVARRIATEGEGAAERLQPLLDRLCRDAQLDDALAVRDVMRQLRGEVTAAVKPDPGYLHADISEVGEVSYYEIEGVNLGTAWGTDVYTSDSSLTAAAVHCGAIEPGEKGIVKVTILPGQLNYPASTRHGVTSSSWGEWHVSFKVERVRVLHRKTTAAAAAKAVADRPVQVIISVPITPPPVDAPKVDAPKVEPPAKP